MKAFRKSTTRIQLEFDTPGQRASLAKLVSYELPGAKHTVAYKSGKWDGTKCFLTDTNTLRVGMFKTLFPEHSLVFDKEFKSLSFDDIPLYQTLNIERRDYQLEAINKILQNKLGIINCIMGSGKCLGKDTPIIMFDGTIKMVQDIIVGDKLLGPDGKSRNVLSTTQGQDNLYKVTPTKGDAYVTNSVHLLSLKMTSGVNHNMTLFDGTKLLKDTKGPIFVETETYYKSNTSKEVLKAWRPDVVEFEHTGQPLTIPPYILGLWLGDGSSKQPELTSIDTEIVSEFENYAKTIGCKIKNISPINKAPTYFLSKDISKINRFMKALREYNLIGNKHIPLDYKTASIKDRLELLAGLLDTDGHLSKGCFEFIQKNKTLANDVLFLCRSLGLAAYITKCGKSISSIQFTGTYYRVSISGKCEIIPTRLPRKQATQRKQKKNVLLTSIKVEPVGYGNYYGFSIDGDRQFLLGDWQVTHNTLMAAATLSYHLSLDSRNKALFVVYDRNILYQTIKNFEKYGFNVSQFGDGVKDLSGDIVVAVINSLNNIEKPKEVLKYVTFVICDEAHHGKSKSSRDVLTKLPNCSYFIGLTATPHVDRSLATAELQSVLGPIIYEYGFTEGVKDGKVAPVKAFFLDTPPNLDIKAQVIERKNYKFIWDTAIKENNTRNKQLADILYYCVELLKTPNLVLVDRVEHGTEMFNHLSKKDGIRATTMFGDDDIILREAKKASLQDDTINTLISTVVKEGVDFPISPVVAVNASGRKSFIPLIQFLGRVTRPNKTFKSFRCYIDTIDHYHPMLRTHSFERIKACEDFGIDVVVCSSVKELIVEIIKHYKACNV